MCVAGIFSPFYFWGTIMWRQYGWQLTNCFYFLLLIYRIYIYHVLIINKMGSLSIVGPIILTPEERSWLNRGVYMNCQRNLNVFIDLVPWWSLMFSTSKRFNLLYLVRLKNNRHLLNSLLLDNQWTSGCCRSQKYNFSHRPFLFSF